MPRSRKLTECGFLPYAQVKRARPPVLAIGVSICYDEGLPAATGVAGVRVGLES